MLNNVECSYREEQDRIAYNKQMNQMNYSGSNYQKKLSFEEVVIEFEEAIRRRITTAYDDNLIPVKKFRDIPFIKEAFETLKKFRPSSKFEKHSVTYLKEIIIDEMYYWKSDDWSHKKINYQIVLSKGFDYLDPFVERYLIQTAKNIAKKQNNLQDKPIPSNPIETPKIGVFEAKNEEPKRCKGRPVGSKNQKPTKETFMPSNIVKINDGKVDLQSLIVAIADLVWRQPEKMDGFYLDLLNLNEGQRKYINKLFIINSPLLQNSYWEIAQKGKTKVLVSKRKRAGYYSNKTSNLLSLSYISEKSGIAIKTLQDRLTKYSIKDAVKMDKYDRL